MNIPWDEVHKEAQKIDQLGTASKNEIAFVKRLQAVTDREGLDGAYGFAFMLLGFIMRDIPEKDWEEILDTVLNLFGVSRGWN